MSSPRSLSPREWFSGFTPLPDAPASRDPLSFPGYASALAEVTARTHAVDSVSAGVAELDGTRAVVILFDFDFFGGSMAEATGRRIVDAIQHATRLRIPLVTIAASGGARMQEGILSLVQMQAISNALSRLARSGVPHLSVACHPTIGAVWVSLVSAADVVLAEAHASISFTGQRVRGAHSTGDEFTAEGQFVAGMVDLVVDRDALPGAVGAYLKALDRAIRSPATRVPAPSVPVTAMQEGHGWGAVQLARDPRRPRAHEYLHAFFDEMLPVSGDRAGGTDPGMLCGLGLRDGAAIAYIAQTGGQNTAAGFRTGTRLLGIAERLRIPVLTLIDTPGAEASAAAEQAGIGVAIGQLMRGIADASVPVTSWLVGEGGSGGALALASPGNLWAVPASYFAVLSPEGAAAILYRDTDRAPEVADAMRVESAVLVEFGIAKWAHPSVRAAPVPG